MDIAAISSMTPPLPTDLKVALRRLWAGKAQGLLVVSILGAVFGANTLTFSFVNEVVLNPLPAIADKSDLVNVHRWRNEKDGLLSFSYPAYQALSEVDQFEGGLVAFNGRGLSLERNSGPELVFGMLVSENYFEALGVRPRLGRSLTSQDNRGGADGVVVLSDSIWRTRFEADPRVLGSAVRLNGRSFTVVGIGPPRFAGHFVGFAADLWVPLVWGPSMTGQSNLLDSRATEWLEVFGRLKSGSAAMAEAALGRVHATRPTVDMGANSDERIVLEPLTGIDRDLRAPVSAFLALLQGAAILVALIALVNVSSLLFARNIERRHDTAVRLALGASRSRLLSPFALEAMILCAAGVLLGFVVAVLGARLAPAFLPPFAIPLRFDLALDARAFLFSALIGFLGTLMATLGPAFMAARTEPGFALSEGGGQRTSRARFRSGLVVTQVAFATAVLMSGSVLARFLAHAAMASPGFDLDRVHITRLDPSVLGATPTEIRAFQQRAVEAIGALPGIESVSLARFAPYSFGTPNLDARDRSAGASAPLINADWNAVSPRFFETLGVGLKRGRTFSEFDREQAPKVVVVNESLAARVFPRGDALGRPIALGPEAETAIVVGVIQDVSVRRLGETPRPQVYRPFAQSPSARVSVFARTSNPEGLTNVIRPALAEATPGLPILESFPLRAFASFSQTGARLGSLVGLGLGSLGLVLAALGLFGLVATTVAARGREVAIRMAMGATSGRILSLILTEGGRLGVAGLLLGALGSLAFSPVLTDLVPDLPGADPTAFLLAALIVVVVLVAATIGPAWRASRILPASVLRSS